MLLFVLHILSYDIWFYVTHLLLHTRPLYWIHKKHHEKPFPQFTDTYHDHILESPIQASGFLLPLLICAFDPYQTIPAILLINARGMLMHDPRGSFIMGDHHLLHHRLSHGNYGQYWLDYMFNTLIVSVPDCALPNNTKTEEWRESEVCRPTTGSCSVGVVRVQEGHRRRLQTESAHQSSVHTAESERSIALD
jgi:sterol desaturase/sphingolipid hydroxylase (fatty acid hydroxylase superfamily)